MDRESILEDALEEIAEMKIPYCDAYDVAHSMRDIAKDALKEIEDESCYFKENQNGKTRSSSRREVS